MTGGGPGKGSHACPRNPKCRPKANTLVVSSRDVLRFAGRLLFPSHSRQASHWSIGIQPAPLVEWYPLLQSPKSPSLCSVWPTRQAEQGTHLRSSDVPTLRRPSVHAAIRRIFPPLPSPVDPCPGKGKLWPSPSCRGSSGEREQGKKKSGVCVL